MQLERAFETFGRLFQLPPATMEGLRASIERRFGANVWQRLHGDQVARELDVPALVVHDADDDQVSVDDGRLLAVSLRRCEYVETTGLGHAKLVRDDAVVWRVIDFVATTMADTTTGSVTAR